MFRSLKACSKAKDNPLEPASVQQHTATSCSQHISQGRVALCHRNGRRQAPVQICSQALRARLREVEAPDEPDSTIAPRPWEERSPRPSN
jgi:hypothetical protein